MGHWNHRVVKRKVREFDKVVDWYGIHEVFYGLGDGDEKLSWTTDAISVEGESVAELRETLGRMLAALDKPVIVSDEK
jgi:hypothetical protein